jgi:LPS-assembly protein
MAGLLSSRPFALRRRRVRKQGFVNAVTAWATLLAVTVGMCLFDTGVAEAQQNYLTFRSQIRPTPPAAGNSGSFAKQALNPGAAASAANQGKMLVHADELSYDYNNSRVSALGNVQIYHNGSTLEADKVIYDQAAKRLHAEGNVRLTEANGKITYGDIIDLSEDFRDGFVDSLRVDTPDQTRMAAARADRSDGNFMVLQNGVYTACEACREDPRKPPLWQVKAARIIHNQTEKMLYFEDASLEFFGKPIAWFPYMSAPDPTVKRKTGFLMPLFSSNSAYGFGVETPYYIAMAPDYDLTLSPRITTKQGPLMQAEWRQRLENGFYTIKGAGLYQFDKDYFIRDDGTPTPGYRDWRGSVESMGRFNVTNNWMFGWDGVLVTDPVFFQNYRIRSLQQRSGDPLGLGLTEGISQLFLTGRGSRSFFDARTIYYTGFSEADVQSALPFVHPVIDYSRTLETPVLGGEVSYSVNLTSLSRASADFDPISSSAYNNGYCAPSTADPAVKTKANCLLRGIAGDYNRLSAETSWKRQIVDTFGQVWTPFMSVRAEVANVNVKDQIGVSNFIAPGETQTARIMPTVGIEYRYPFIGVQSWGTQTVEPIAQLIVRPSEQRKITLPNEDAQSLVYDDTNLFKVDKFSGWDRTEGGGRANAGVQYTAQFNRGGFVNVLFGQSYQLFGENSFAMGDLTNTGLNSGLDTSRADYVARLAYQPNKIYSVISRFRFDEADFTLRRLEIEGRANFDRWGMSVLYGNYDAQPLLGFLTRREGVLGMGSVKLDANWVLSGAARYDIDATKFNQLRFGVGYIDDCFIMSLNYITDYNYSGNVQTNHSVMFQVSLRTLGGTGGVGAQ